MPTWRATGRTAVNGRTPDGEPCEMEVEYEAGGPKYRVMRSSNPWERHFTLYRTWDAASPRFQMGSEEEVYAFIKDWTAQDLKRPRYDVIVGDFAKPGEESRLSYWSRAEADDAKFKASVQINQIWDAGMFTTIIEVPYEEWSKA